MTSDQCIACKHYLGLQECKAFKKIPYAIISGEFDHRKSFEGDNGIQFEPIEKKKKHDLLHRNQGTERSV